MMPAAESDASSGSDDDSDDAPPHGQPGHVHGAGCGHSAVGKPAAGSKAGSKGTVAAAEEDGEDLASESDRSDDGDGDQEDGDEVRVSSPPLSTNPHALVLILVVVGIRVCNAAMHSHDCYC